MICTSFGSFCQVISFENLSFRLTFLQGNRQHWQIDNTKMRNPLTNDDEISQTLMMWSHFKYLIEYFYRFIPSRMAQKLQLHEIDLAGAKIRFVTLNNKVEFIILSKNFSSLFLHPFMSLLLFNSFPSSLLSSSSSIDTQFFVSLSLPHLSLSVYCSCSSFYLHNSTFNIINAHESTLHFNCLLHSICSIREIISFFFVLFGFLFQKVDLSMFVQCFNCKYCLLFIRKKKFAAFLSIYAMHCVHQK